MVHAGYVDGAANSQRTCYLHLIERGIDGHAVTHGDRFGACRGNIWVAGVDIDLLERERIDDGNLAGSIQGDIGTAIVRRDGDVARESGQQRAAHRAAGRDTQRDLGQHLAKRAGVRRIAIEDREGAGAAVSFRQGDEDVVAVGVDLRRIAGGPIGRTRLVAVRAGKVEGRSRAATR